MMHAVIHILSSFGILTILSFLPWNLTFSVIFPFSYFLPFYICHRSSLQPDLNDMKDFKNSTNMVPLSITDVCVRI